MAWHTPIPELLIALDARVEWADRTNPFAAPKKPKASKASVAARLKFALMAAGAKPSDQSPPA